MRPVNKGACPYSAISNYQQARRPLIERLGELCSYCEMHLDASLAVEHVQPKSLYPEKICSWENLLLACVNCNATKGNTDINDANMNDYLWPHIHNTFLALKYYEGGIVRVNDALHPDIQAKAQKLISLVGLDKNPGNSANVSDRRWNNRLDAFGRAQRAKERLSTTDTPNMREQIVDQAEGYFSIWMTVFSDDADMKKRLIDKFVGTAKDAFDAQGNPIPRMSQGV